MNTTTDYYRTLQVDPGADPEVIEAAFKRLARKYHPDVGGSTAGMTALNEAYEVLRDPTARAAYDRVRHSTRSSHEATTAPPEEPPPPQSPTASQGNSGFAWTARVGIGVLVFAALIGVLKNGSRTTDNRATSSGSDTPAVHGREAAANGSSGDEKPGSRVDAVPRQNPVPPVSSPAPRPPIAAERPPALRFASTSFTVEYPTDWSAKGNAAGDAVFIGRDGFTRRRFNGDTWYDYGVAVFSESWPEGAHDLMMMTNAAIARLVQGSPGVQRLNVQPVQTAWGEGLWSDLQAPTPYQYVEYTRLLTIDTPERIVGVMFQAPSSEFNQMAPVFDRILSSLVLR